MFLAYWWIGSHKYKIESCSPAPNSSELCRLIWAKLTILMAKSYKSRRPEKLRYQSSATITLANTSSTIGARYYQIAMTDKLLLATILCLMGSSALAQQAILEGNYNVTAFCSAVATGTQLGSIVSCEYYYVCQSTGPVQVNCTAGYAYNYTVQACQPASQANCFYGLENPCSATTGDSFAPVAGTCNMYYACKNGAANGTGQCPAKTKFDSVSRSCIYGSCSSSQALSGTPNLNSLCEVVPPKIFFGTTEDCSTWNYCEPGKANPTTSQCATPTSVSNHFIIENNCCKSKPLLVCRNSPSTCKSKFVTTQDPVYAIV